ncbi:MAG TPA: ATP-dependent DNA helicase [Candidatus Rifleibacterium sp.]|nr:ATP-dependent DNA helicase [Candidatus Rifleibacterium sp.]HPT45697.1 ATP-dependent DNA helicase [Candidatus Rifleibacterium sp.]
MNKVITATLSEDLKRLNEQQAAIVKKFNRPSLIVAGPGTGKTRTISVLIGDMLHKGVRLREILALTFSDKAALELRERVLQYFPHSFDQCWISTFHSFCARILREYYHLAGVPPDFKLLTGFKEALMMSGICGRQQPESFSEFGKVLRKRGFQQEVLTFISLLKSNLVSVEEFKAAIADVASLPERTRVRLSELLTLFRAYESERIRTGYLDFRDLISLSIKVLHDPVVAASYRKRFKVILVDEFQDTDPAQYLLLTLLKGDDTNIRIAVIGDPRQSIYRFRGADPSMMTAAGPFKKKFNARVFPLAINYRSAGAIVAAATRLAWKDKTGSGDLEAHSQKPGFVRFFKVRDELEEARLLSRKIASLLIYGAGLTYRPSDVAILVRNNFQIDLIAECLQALHIPFAIAGDMKFFKSEEVITLASLLKIAALPGSERHVFLQRAFSSPVFNISPLWIQAVFAKLTPVFTMQHLLDKLSAGAFAELPETDEETRVRAASFAEMVRMLDNCADEPLSMVFARLLLVIAPLLVDPASPQARNILHFRSMIADYCEVFAAQFSRQPLTGDLMSEFDEWLTYYASTLEQVEDCAGEGVRIMTIHQSKGLEFPIVAVCGLCEGQFPVKLRENLLISTSTIELLRGRFDQAGRQVSFFNPYPGNLEEHLEEERRLFYVALTRAKDGLLLTCPQRLGTDPAMPSPFLHEIGLHAEVLENEERPLTLGEFRTRLNRLSGAELADFEPVIAELEPQVSPESSVHGLRPRSFTIPETDMIELSQNFAFSASSLASYIDCPRRFFFMNVLRIQNPLLARQPFFITGNAFHACLEALHKPGSVWESGKFPADEDLETILTGSAMPLLGNLDFFQRHLETEGLRNALPVYRAAVFAQNQVPSTGTIGVEHSFNFVFNDCRLRGRFDRLVKIDKDAALVVDYKTTQDSLTSEKVFAQAFPEAGLPRELQMPLYLLACRRMGYRRASAVLLYVRRDAYKKPPQGMQAGFLRSAALNYGCGPEYGTEVNDGDFARFEDNLKHVLDEIRNDRTFDCRPSAHPDARSCLNHQGRKAGCEFFPFCQERLAELKIIGEAHEQPDI